MAVLPEYQHKGIGTQLVKSGLLEARDLQYDSVIVLGHPQFYTRFGFVPASTYDIQCPFPAPDEAFMVIELRANALKGRRGKIEYLPPFYEL